MLYLHAGTSFEAHERVALERFCRYALRGPLAQARLSARSDGKLVYRLKAPKPDGTTHLIFSPLTLLQRLSWLIPLPRIHLTRPSLPRRTTSTSAGARSSRSDSTCE